MSLLEILFPVLLAASGGLVDFQDARVAATARELTRGLQDDRAKAVALHDFVRDQIAFGWHRSFYRMTAAEVLEARIGYCNTKSTLFVALLRAAGLQAKLHFVSIDAQILHGILQLDRAYVDHSFVEVLIEGRWIKTDSYIVDRRLFEKAQAKLRAEGRALGYGVHRNGSCFWDGRTHSFSQFVDDGSVPTLTSKDYGIHPDVLALYRVEDGYDELSAVARFLFPVLIRGANEQVCRLREAP